MSPSADIRSWLEGIDLGELVTLFEENCISLDVLPTLTADDLSEMGITVLGHRKRLLFAIAQLNVPTTPPTPTAPESPPAPTVVRDSTLVPSAPQQMPVKAAPPVVREITAPAPAPEIPQPAIDLQPVELPSAAAATKSKRRAFSASFLTVSISLHLILGLGAGYWVVQRIEAKRKLQFAAGPPTANPNKRALDHKVSLQKKKNAGGLPAQAKRIAVTGLSAKITLPEMPAVPTTSTQFVAGRMGGMGGAGSGSGLGFGNGSGMGVGGAGAGGLGLTMFGARGGAGLTGTFYDLKQTKDRRPTDMTGPPNEGVDASGPLAMRYKSIVKQFVRSWYPSTLSKYFVAPGKLSVTQLFIPKLLAEEAPKAFQVEKEVQGRRWLVHYQGSIVAPRDGKFRFVGSGDDFLIVRCKGYNVLDASIPGYQVVPEANESNNVGDAVGFPLAAGKWIQMRQNEVMQMEVLIGENPGGEFTCFLLIEEQGVAHPPGVFPVFQLRKGDVPKGAAPDHHGTIVFGSRATGSGSPLDSIKRP